MPPVPSIWGPGIAHLQICGCPTLGASLPLRLGWDTPIDYLLVVLALPLKRLTRNDRCDILGSMGTSETTRSAYGVDHNRLILSLAGAVLISAAGFGLIFLFTAWLIPKWMMWSAKEHNHGIIPELILVFFLFLMMTTAARRRRNIQKKLFHPKQTILPL